MGKAWTHHPNLGSAPAPEMEVVAGTVLAATGAIPDWSAACHTAVDVAFSAQFGRMVEFSSINVEFLQLHSLLVLARFSAFVVACACGKGRHRII